jgi:hypothetical protein
MWQKLKSIFAKNSGSNLLQSSVANNLANSLPNSENLKGALRNYVSAVNAMGNTINKKKVQDLLKNGTPNFKNRFANGIAKVVIASRGAKNEISNSILPNKKVVNSVNKASNHLIALKNTLNNELNNSNNLSNEIPLENIPRNSTKRNFIVKVSKKTFTNKSNLNALNKVWGNNRNEQYNKARNIITRKLKTPLITNSQNLNNLRARWSGLPVRAEPRPVEYKYENPQYNLN